MQDRDLPVLWHLEASNYNEKARWAIDFKGLRHARRSVDPPRHRAIARRLTQGTTFPVLEVDGAAIGDSTAIIAALEDRCPDPPLYPSDPGDRERALALEDFFDEELGPSCRMLVIHHLLPDARLMLDVFTPGMPGPRRLGVRALFPVLRPRLAAQFGIDAASVDRAYEKVRIAGERLQATAGPEGYLVGDRFTVADLTLAALASPAVTPREFPYPQPQRDHPRLAPLRAALQDAGIMDWALEMYARHRGVSAEVAGAGR